MPKVTHVKSARKDNEVVKKGEPYWWAAFKTGPTSSRIIKWSKPPRPSQLTLSSYLSSALALGEQLEDFTLTGYQDAESVIQDSKDFLEEIKGQVEELKEECDESLSNMPEGLQQSSTGELLQSRIDGCETATSNLDEAIGELDNISTEKDEEDKDVTQEDFIAGVCEAALEIIHSIDLSEMQGN